MNRNLRLVIGLAAGILGVAVATGPAEAGDLASDLRALVGKNLNVGVQILDCTTGAPLYSHNASEPFIPASNLKVITTAAALECAGDGFKFETRLFATTEGTRTILTLVGSGDPALFDPELISVDGSHGNWTTVAAACDAWAASLKASGLTRISEFVLDARVFDLQPCPVNDPKWVANRTDGTYAVGVWGFNVAGNAARLQFGWNEGHRPSVSASEPPIPWRIAENSATCRTNGRGFGVGYGSGVGELRLGGSLAKPTDTADVGILDPLPLSAEMFALQLRLRGIDVGSWRLAVQSDPEPRGAIVAPTLVTPILTVLTGANTHSKNICADALIKFIGAIATNKPGAIVGPDFRSGSFESGESALKQFLDRRLGAGCSGVLCARDGSGLSASNRVTADLTARVIASMATDARLGPWYASSFARPREAGTLKKRFANTDLHGALVLGKSGYINGVCCLSGLVVGSNGRQVAYSVICNKAEPSRDKKLHEDIVARIAKEIGSGHQQHAAAGDRN